MACTTCEPPAHDVDVAILDGDGCSSSTTNSSSPCDCYNSGFFFDTNNDNDNNDVTKSSGKVFQDISNNEGSLVEETTLACGNASGFSFPLLCVAGEPTNLYPSFDPALPPPQTDTSTNILPYFSTPVSTTVQAPTVARSEEDQSLYDIIENIGNQHMATMFASSRHSFDPLLARGVNYGQQDQPMHQPPNHFLSLQQHQQQSQDQFYIDPAVVAQLDAAFMDPSLLGNLDFTAPLDPSMLAINPIDPTLLASSTSFYLPPAPTLPVSMTVPETSLLAVSTPISYVVVDKKPSTVPHVALVDNPAVVNTPVLNVEIPPKTTDGQNPQCGSSSVDTESFVPQLQQENLQQQQTQKQNLVKDQSVAKQVNRTQLASGGPGTWSSATSHRHHAKRKGSFSQQQLPPQQPTPLPAPQQHEHLCCCSVAQSVHDHHGNDAARHDHRHQNQYQDHYHPPTMTASSSRNYRGRTTNYPSGGTPSKTKTRSLLAAPLLGAPSSVSSFARCVRTNKPSGKRTVGHSGSYHQYQNQRHGMDAHAMHSSNNNVNNGASNPQSSSSETPAALSSDGEDENDKEMCRLRSLYAVLVREIVLDAPRYCQVTSALSQSAQQPLEGRPWCEVTVKTTAQAGVLFNKYPPRSSFRCVIGANRPGKHGIVLFDTQAAFLAQGKAVVPNEGIDQIQFTMPRSAAAPTGGLMSISQEISARTIDPTPPSHYLPKYPGAPGREVDASPEEYDHLFLIEKKDQDRARTMSARNASSHDLSENIATDYVLVDVTFSDPDKTRVAHMVRIVREGMLTREIRCLTRYGKEISLLSPNDLVRDSTVQFLVHRDDAYVLRTLLEDKKCIVEDGLYCYRGTSVVEHTSFELALRALEMVFARWPALSTACYRSMNPLTHIWRSGMDDRLKEIPGFSWERSTIHSFIGAIPHPLYAYVFAVLRWVFAPVDGVPLPWTHLPGVLSPSQKAQMQNSFYWRCLDPEGSRVDHDLLERILDYYDSVGYRVYLVKEHRRNGRTCEEWEGPHKSSVRREVNSEDLFAPLPEARGVKRSLGAVGSVDDMIQGSTLTTTSSTIARTPARYYPNPTHPFALRTRFRDQKNRKVPRENFLRLLPPALERHDLTHRQQQVPRCGQDTQPYLPAQPEQTSALSDPLPVCSATTPTTTTSPPPSTPLDAVDHTTVPADLYALQHVPSPQAENTAI